jgi:acetyl esterase/lipase
VSGKTGVEFCDGASIRALLLAPLLRLAVRPLVDRWPITPRRLWLLRILMNARTTVIRPRRGALVQPVIFESFAAEWVDASPVAVTRDRVVLYLHGGGFVAGSPRSHRGLVSRLSERARGPVLSVDFRHPPEAPVETAVRDCVTAFEWLLDQGWRADQVVIAGDGTGGTLAFSTALRLRDAGKPLPGGLVAMSPWLDLTLSGGTITTNARRDPLMSLPFATRCVEVCAEDADLGDPRLSPVRAHASDLPPVLLQVGAGERLRGDSELMADRLMKASVPCTLQLWSRQVHGFQALAGLLPDSRRAIVAIGDFTRRVTPAAPAASTGRQPPRHARAVR